MKVGDRVSTPDGPGTIIIQEGKDGILSRRFGVQLDKVPEGLWLYGLKAVYYMDTDLKPIDPVDKSQMKLFV